MAIGVVFNESTVALTEEVTEGTYVAPSSGTDYVEALAEGLEFNKTREELTRNTLGGSVESEASRVGIAEVAGSISLEYKASATEGNSPQSLDLLLRGLLGGKRQITADQTSGTTHTATRINFADTSAFNVGDVVLVKESGAFEMRPISAISTNAYIEFPIALENGAPSDNVVVAQVTTYYSDTKNAPSLSAEHNIGQQAIKQKVRGLRVASAALENYSVGQIPNISFGLQGLDVERVDEDATASADFSADGEPPVALSACLWVGGQKLAYTELSLNVENTVNYLTSACDADGRISSRITEQVTTFTCNPYLDDSDLTKTWNKFNDNDDVSVFFYIYNPTSTDGEFGQGIGVYLPQARITAAPLADQDGIVTEALEIKAHRSSQNDSIFMSFA
jgi:hypothetical protein